jgi:hypothetical protein
MIEGWGKASPGGVSYYNYMFNLAEYSAPYPMMHQMKEELPIIYANHVKYWQPEGMANFDEVLPGLYLTMRKAWNPNANSDAVLDEFFTRFYGNAEKPMRKYWTLFDNQWTNVDEHSGGGWSYGRRVALTTAPKSPLDTRSKATSPKNSANSIPNGAPSWTVSRTARA